MLVLWKTITKEIGVLIGCIWLYFITKQSQDVLGPLNVTFGRCELMWIWKITMNPSVSKPISRISFDWCEETLKKMMIWKLLVVDRSVCRCSRCGRWSGYSIKWYQGRVSLSHWPSSFVNTVWEQNSPNHGKIIQVWKHFFKRIQKTKWFFPRISKKEKIFLLLLMLFRISPCSIRMFLPLFLYDLYSGRY